MLSAIGMCVESEGEVRENATDQAQDKIKQKSDFAKKNTFHCLGFLVMNYPSIAILYVLKTAISLIFR